MLDVYFLFFSPLTFISVKNESVFHASQKCSAAQHNIQRMYCIEIERKNEQWAKATGQDTYNLFVFVDICDDRVRQHRLYAIHLSPHPSL